MRLEQLKYFISIAHTQSINKTSLEFYTTHQGISKAIRQLEDEMGATLFTRSAKGMLLTKEGELLLPVAQNCVKELHRIQLEIQHLQCAKPLAGLLQLYGTPVSDAIVLPELLDDFGILYPDVQYQVDEANTIDILRNVSLHRNMLGLVAVLRNPVFSEIYTPYLSQVQCYPLQQDEYICVVGASSPLAERKRISFNELANYPVTTFLPDASESHPLRQLLQKFGTTIALAAQTPHLLAQAITSGKYVAISSRRIRTEAAFLDSDKIVALPFDEDLTLDLMLVTNLQPELDDVGQAFLALVKERSASTQH